MANASESLARGERTGERSLEQIVEAVVRDIQTIVRAELRLVRREFTEKMAHVKNASIFLAAAVCMGFLGVASLVTACISALAVALPLWLSALVMGVLCCAAAAGAFVAGRSRLDRIDPVPHETVRTVRENLEWTKQRAS